MNKQAKFLKEHRGHNVTQVEKSGKTYITCLTCGKGITV